VVGGGGVREKKIPMEGEGRGNCNNHAGGKAEEEQQPAMGGERSTPDE